MINENLNFWRVKLYSLGGDGEWADKGTGRLNITGRILNIESEDEAEISLLNFEIGNEVYKRQGTTIIT